MVTGMLCEEGVNVQGHCISQLRLHNKIPQIGKLDTDICVLSLETRNLRYKYSRSGDSSFLGLWMVALLWCPHREESELSGVTSHNNTGIRAPLL